MTTQMPSETPWDAIINDNSMDIVEESDFEAYLCEMGLADVYKKLPLSRLEKYHHNWKNERGENLA